MPRTPPTIIAPLPNDPRVMSLAKSVSLTRREAFAAAAEAWAWMRDHAIDDIVVKTAPDSLDAVVDVDGFGDAMFQAGLVGVVNDGLVLPAELRHHERDDRGGPAAASAGVPHVDEKNLRRKAQNAASSQRYRRKNRGRGSKAKPEGGKTYRSLGRVAGHEVRVVEGPHGPYARVLGVTVNGESYNKLTVGVADLDTAKLADVLPTLVEKWKDKSRPRGLDTTGPALVPSYADFRDDAERLTMLAKLAAEGARHADAADASARHADASASSAGPSADHGSGGERKSFDGMGLDASAASTDRHADAPSSMSFSKSSSSNEEEDMAGEGRKTAGMHEPDQGDAVEPERIAEWDHKRQRKRMLAEKFAAHLHESVETILTRWKHSGQYLILQLEAAGIDPNTGEPFNAEAPHKPAQARADIDTTTEPTTNDTGVTGGVDARDHAEFDCAADDIRRGLQQAGIVSPVKPAPLADDCAFVSAANC